MKIAKLSVLAVAALGMMAGAAHANAVLYADDFNRANATGLGSTSTGGYAWTEVGAAETDYAIDGNRLRVNSQFPHSSQRAFVDVDLDGYHAYHVAFTFQSSTSAGTAAAQFLLPRAQGTDIPGNSGWVLEFTNNSSPFHIRRYEGQARSGSTISMSGLTAVASSLALTSAYDFRINVVGNSASLWLDGVHLDTISLGSVAGNGTKDVMMFGYNQTDASGRNLVAYYDNLSVTAPEPASFGAIALAGAVLRRRSARR